MLGKFATFSHSEASGPNPRASGLLLDSPGTIVLLGTYDWVNQYIGSNFWTALDSGSYKSNISSLPVHLEKKRAKLGSVEETDRNSSSPGKQTLVLERDEHLHGSELISQSQIFSINNNRMRSFFTKYPAPYHLEIFLL